MQTQLPFFPETTQLLSPTWGVFIKDDFVYYLHNGTPVHLHHKNDMQTFRYITATLIENNSCSATALSKVFSFNVRNFYRYTKQLRENGIESFSKPNDARGQCYKMTEEKIKDAQEFLDNNYSQNRTAKEIGVNEASIRYHLKKGTLKKKE
ncbi:MAG: hypothetical protein KAI79_19775 [Bacteroidales bacterium]|nr:hypothetical protein [Bacteroidales bacterium]